MMSKTGLITMVVMILIIFTLIMGTYLNHTAYGMWSDIPENPEVHFTAKVPQYIQIQRDFSISLVAIDDRSEYHKYAPSTGKIQGADVNISFYHGDRLIEDWNGITGKRGLYTGNDIMTSHDYPKHGLIDVIVTVSYMDHIEIQTFKVWTIQRVQ